MKEIWKLIELLNEFINKTIYPYDRGAKCIWYENHLFLFDTWTDVLEDTVISARYGFIKWLVENDKIDIVKVYENLTNYEIEIRIRAVKELLDNNEEDTIAYLKLLMLLAIQDEPIRFLCEVLK